MSATAVLSTADLGYVRELVRRSSANVLDEGKGYLIESRLTALARREGIASLPELVSTLRRSAPGPLHERVVHAMTTNETSWFRDVRPYEVLTSTVLPELIAARSATRTLNIWSAACSSGQEPYTIAMLIRDRFPQLREWNVRIIASDLSAEMLGRAAEGRYSQLEMNRGLPATMLVRYFERVGADWRVRDEIREMVEFRTVNLVRPWSFLPAMDLVMLRNVLIYFDVPTKREVLARVRTVLRPEGALFLGAAETTLNLDDAYERVSVDGSSYYRHRPHP